MTTTKLPNEWVQPGEFDPAFANNGVFAVPSDGGSIKAIVADGSGGFILAIWVAPQVWLYRILADGALDHQFGQNGVSKWSFSTGLNSAPAKLFLQSDGKILLLGYVLRGIDKQTALTRFNPSGSPDLIFGNQFIPGVELFASSGAVQADGKILVLISRAVGATGAQKAELYRLLPSGGLDHEFGEQGFVEIQVNGKALLGSAVAVAEDGNILIGGTVRQTGPTPPNKAVVRLSPDGSLDPSFGQGGYWESDSNNTLLTMAVARGTIICAGAGAESACFSRLTAGGAFDPGFNNGQTLHVPIPSSTSSTCEAVAVQPDGKLVAGGVADAGSSTYWLRLMPDGRLDPDFGNDGIFVHDKRSHLHDLQSQPDKARFLAAVDSTEHGVQNPYVFGIFSE
ncbi:Delta-60 repeat protein [Pseudomonas sp. IT-P12]|jgi:uncharacterized delta-60 repeat protein|uniref:hypothetical protein n=1 Tax=Pseudomonas TaxID=286 RepID=UPI0019135382|nr:hypothetical protein [Pseudomonas fluorescens]